MQLPSISRYVAVAALSLVVFTHAAHSKQQQTRSTAANTLTVPDGTPLYVTLQNDFTSATVKIGDTIAFATPYPMRVDGLVVLPRDTQLNGKVTQILPPRRASRDSRVFIAIDTVSLPNGRTVNLRPQKTPSKNPEHDAKEIGSHPSMWTDTSVNQRGTFVPPSIVVTAFSEKGRDWVYKAGSWSTVYFDGAVSIERSALAGLEPPPYAGPAQVFIHGPNGKLVQFYLDHATTVPGMRSQAMTGELALPARIEFWPGHYSISSHKNNSRAAELDLEDDHQYWLEYEHGALTVADPAPHQAEMEQLAVAPWVTNKIAISWWFRH